MKVIIANYCKNNKISGRSLKEIYDHFSQRSFFKPPITRDEFYLVMLELNKEPARWCRQKCREYYITYGILGYTKFCIVYYPISEEFWKKVTGDNLDKADLGYKKPVNATWEDQSKAQKKQPEEKSEFEKMLPLNWASMTNSERIEFAQIVRNDGFKNFILNSDPSIKKFFSITQKETKFKMYVTMFQFPKKSHSKEARELLKTFVDNLNSLGRANLQYVECSNPDVVEIREVR